MGTQRRNVLFVSHANPEDNQFSLWLSLQLVKEGYAVWCDQIRLLGGEDFWSDIEDVLRTRAVKLIYVLSRASNHKTGPLQELQVGISVSRHHGYKDFIIPLRLDDLPHSDINIQLARLNAIDFSAGWPPGFRSLLAKLELDGVRKDPRFSPEVVASWWRTNVVSDINLAHSPETYLSNWFGIKRLPDAVYVHNTTGLKGRSLKSTYFSYPLRRQRQLLISFASADDLEPDLLSGARITSSCQIPTNELISGHSGPLKLTASQSRKLVVDLLRQGWNHLIKSRGMSTYLLSNGSLAAYLAQGQVHRNRVNIPVDSGRGPATYFGRAAFSESWPREAEEVLALRH